MHNNLVPVIRHPNTFSQNLNIYIHLHMYKLLVDININSIVCFNSKLDVWHHEIVKCDRPWFSQLQV